MLRRMWIIIGSRRLEESREGRKKQVLMTDLLHISEHRALTEEELILLDWLLAHGRSDASHYTSQTAKLRVVSRCGCGCPTIDFAIGVTRKDGPSHIIADAEGTSPEGVRVEVIVHIRESEISELEVVSATGESVSLPKPESLVPWPEDLGEFP
jgi:hypothetical protein